MSRPSVIGHLRRGDELRRRSVTDAPDVLQLGDTVVPLPEASMRVLEFTVACVALGVALLLSLAR